MGWFDESDDSDDEKNHKLTTLDVSTSITDKIGNNDKDDDEDPLDAYMKTLDSVGPLKNTLRENPPLDTNSRLDFLNEEEEDDAVIWTKTNTDRRFDGRNVDDENDDNNWDEHQREPNRKIQSSSSSEQTKAARDALNLHFRKAIGGKQQDPTNDTQDKKSRTTENNSSIKCFEQDESLGKFEKSFWFSSHSIEGKQWRIENDVRCSPLQRTMINDNATVQDKLIIPDPIYEFHELRDVMGNELLLSIMNQYSKPTLVQSQTIPLTLSGNDSIVTAATGQGKTLAYLWPIIVHLIHQPPLRQDLSETGPIALVLVPTRELAIQVQKQANLFLKTTTRPNSESNNRSNTALSCRAVIGGVGKFVLRQEVKKSGGVEIVVATPGRLIDVLSDRKGLSLQRVTFVVLDEADKMLQMGFEADVRRILSGTRSDRQTIMMSATMGHRVEKVATEWLLPNAIRVSIGRTGEASHNVDQHAIVLPDNDAKITFLLEMIPTLVQLGRIIIFVATKEGCETLSTILQNKLVLASSTTNIRIETLHGDKHQTDRNAAVRAFTKGDINVLVATDVAGRGLDIPNVQTVLSFDPAKNLDAHVHRVGRAGRLSKDCNKEQQQLIGSAYTLLTSKNAEFAHVLMQAFTREGREVSSALQGLAKQSRQAGNFESKNQSLKGRLGHDYISTSSQASTDSLVSSTATSHQVEPSAKRSRWS